jgi:hypothetical protein
MGPEGIGLKHSRTQECLNGKPAKSGVLLEFLASELCFSLTLTLALALSRLPEFRGLLRTTPPP